MTLMSKLQGKVAVITGGTTGIGFAIAKRFVDEGAFVFITGRRQKELDEAVKVLGSNVAGVRGDVSKLQDLDRLYGRCCLQQRGMARQLGNRLVKLNGSKTWHV
jgi:NAD(P)-dependent dehydrogenase (short-subunit alcohol dehydrogenase family)